VIGVVILTAMGLTLGILDMSGSPRTETSTSARFEVPIASASTLDPSNGLRLDLNLSEDTTGILNITVAESNTLSIANNVTVADDWPLPGDSLFLWAEANCVESPIGYEVLQGHYGLSNYTEGVPLYLIAQGPEQCAVFLQPGSLLFAPLSDVATNVNKPVALSDSWSGYWVGSNGEYSAGSCQASGAGQTNECTLALTPFPPGGYTVVAGSEWGQAVLLHFTVTG